MNAGTVQHYRECLYTVIDKELRATKPDVRKLRRLSQAAQYILQASIDDECEWLWPATIALTEAITGCDVLHTRDGASVYGLLIQDCETATAATRILQAMVDKKMPCDGYMSVIDELLKKIQK